MHAVIMTFPGHFYQTHLTTRSLLARYPEVEHITFVLDDVEQAPWPQYVDDFASSIGSVCSVSWDAKTTSSMPGVRDCVAGWWRQQLVKLTLDLLLADDDWFVVDGDVIFDTRCDVRGVVPIRRHGDSASAWAVMCVNYVQNLLGAGPGYIQESGLKVNTSPIPFRWLDRDLLQGLRQHVESRYHRDFLQAHLDWFDDQTIVANWDPPDRWVMSEWELIECYRRYVLDQAWPVSELGSGYAIDRDTSKLSVGQNLFRHAYQRDQEIPWQTFPRNGQAIDPVTWHRARTWYDAVERPNRS